MENAIPSTPPLPQICLPVVLPRARADYSLVGLKLLESSFPSESKLHPQSEGSTWPHPEQIFLFSAQPIQHVQTAATPPVSKHFQLPSLFTSAWLPALTILPGLPPPDLLAAQQSKAGAPALPFLPGVGRIGKCSWARVQPELEGEEGSYSSSSTAIPNSGCTSEPSGNFPQQ